MQSVRLVPQTVSFDIFMGIRQERMFHGTRIFFRRSVRISLLPATQDQGPGTMSPPCPPATENGTDVNASHILVTAADGGGN